MDAFDDLDSLLGSGAPEAAAWDSDPAGEAAEATGAAKGSDAAELARLLAAPIAAAAPRASRAAPIAAAAPRASRAAPKRAAPKRAAPARAPPAPEQTSAPEQRILLSSFRAAAKTKGMWAGALAPMLIPDLQGAVEAPAAEPSEAEAEAGAESGTESEGSAASTPREAPPRLRLVPLERLHTPALLKIIDEILVNATDHAKDHESGPAAQRVRRVEVSFDAASGRVAVLNDGPGIPVAVHAAASAAAGREVYVPEVAFAFEFAGGNVERPAGCRRGGINGLGAKLANIHSLDFEIETVDAAAGLRYAQRFRERLEVTEPPRVAPAGRAPPFTRVSFVPAYAALGYGPGPAGPLAAEDAAELDAWLRLRAHQAAAYLGPKARVSYNGGACATASAAALAALVLTALGPDAEQALVLSALARSDAELSKAHPWGVAAILLPAGRWGRAGAQGMAIVNGVASPKGSHVRYFRGLVHAAIEARLRKATKSAKAPRAAKGAKPARAADAGKVSMAETLAGVRLVLVGSLAGADWSGQRKDELQVPAGELEGYGLPAAFLKQLGEAAAERILVGRGERAAGHGAIDKYVPAGRAGRADRRHTTLMLAEGDSAIGLFKRGLSLAKRAPPGGPTRAYVGYLSLQGVVLNSARNVSELETSSGETLLVRTAKLQANARLNAIVAAYGLRFGRKYETAAELETLRYGRLLIACDQDADGVGRIAPLVTSFLFAFWPALFAAGRVGRFMTPVARAFPRRGRAPPAEFFYEAELRAWLAADPARARAHEVRYYKGLAGHSAEDVARMFEPRAFEAAVHMLDLGEGREAVLAVRRRFAEFFGADSAPRKLALVTPVVHLAAEEAARLRLQRRIPVLRVHLDIDTKGYKLEALRRTLPGIVDGLNPVRRKVLAGAFRHPAPSKVYQLGGRVAAELFYHHGDAPLCGCITYLAQAFTGARRYPLLSGSGEFGSRHGDEAGSARYISVALGRLAAAAFPAADRFFLPYVFEEGERAEAEYLLPVVPLAVLESAACVSEGWKCSAWARDPAAVRRAVAAYLAGDAGLHAAAEALRAGAPGALAAARLLEARWPLPASTRGYRGEVRRDGGLERSVGYYEWFAESRTAVVTDLPIGLPTSRYLKALLGVPLDRYGQGQRAAGRAAKLGRLRNELIESVEDLSGPDAVELRFVLREGAFEEIAEAYGGAALDPLEDALQLSVLLRAHLNYFDTRGAVFEAGDCYLAPLLTWAALRRDLYRERLVREEVVLELRVAEEAAVLRFIGMSAALDLACVADEAAAEQLLRGHGFEPLDTALLHAPKFTPNAELRRLVTAGPGASFDYLLSLREAELVAAAAAKRRARMEALAADLARARAELQEQPFPGISSWEREAAEFWRLAGE